MLYITRAGDSPHVEIGELVLAHESDPSTVINTACSSVRSVQHYPSHGPNS